MARRRPEHGSRLDWRPAVDALLDRSQRARDYLETSSAAFTTRLNWDAMPYPHYAYGLLQAALQARGLKIPEIAAIEFGVAGGSGLVALERHAADVEELTGVRVRTFGFDTGEGLPSAQDYRDLPYIWKPGYFKMDLDALRARLRRSELILGDVRVTVPDHVERTDVPPLGYVSFDLDYYTSTVSAMGVLRGSEPTRLPRVFCHFDDIIGTQAELHSRYAGELLAIEEFNEAHAERKLAPINGLRHKRRLYRPWNDELFVLHDFAHSAYNVHLGPEHWDLALD
jgi:hypothetical protein